VRFEEAHMAAKAGVSMAASARDQPYKPLN
jgi:hypothetical protein